MKTDSTSLPPSIKFASLGTISHGTLRTEDLLNSFASELEWQIGRNGAFLSMPENFPLRDRLAKLLGEAQDAWNEDGKTLQDEENAAEMVNDLQNALSEVFAAPYSYFGNTEGDGSDFGFWPDIESAKEGCDFVSSESEEFPPSGFTGEWLHVNERGNCALYVRDAQGNSVELWSCV